MPMPVPHEQRYVDQARDQQDQMVDETFALFRELAYTLRKGAALDWVSEVDLTLAQMKVLFVLWHHGPQAVGAVADALRIRQPTASHLLDRLVQSGLVTRAEDPEDRRRTLVRLASEGEHLIVRLTGGFQRLRDWLRTLDQEDLAAFHQGLAALARVARQMAAVESGSEAGAPADHAQGQLPPCPGRS
jgi:DNA-binding MarR family transcriptional regulator